MTKIGMLFFLVILAVSGLFPETASAEKRMCYMSDEFIVVTPVDQKFDKIFFDWKKMEIRDGDNVGNADAILSIVGDKIKVEVAYGYFGDWVMYKELSFRYSEKPEAIRKLVDSELNKSKTQSPPDKRQKKDRDRNDKVQLRDV